MVWPFPKYILRIGPLYNKFKMLGVWPRDEKFVSREHRTWFLAFALLKDLSFQVDESDATAGRHKMTFLSTIILFWRNEERRDCYFVDILIARNLISTKTLVPLRLSVLKETEWKQNTLRWDCTFQLQFRLVFMYCLLQLVKDPWKMLLNPEKRYFTWKIKATFTIFSNIDNPATSSSIYELSGRPVYKPETTEGFTDQNATHVVKNCTLFLTQDSQD